MRMGKPDPHSPPPSANWVILGRKDGCNPKWTVIPVRTDTRLRVSIAGLIVRNGHGVAPRVV